MYILKIWYTLLNFPLVSYNIYAFIDSTWKHQFPCIHYYLNSLILISINFFFFDWSVSKLNTSSHYFSLNYFIILVWIILLILIFNFLCLFYLALVFLLWTVYLFPLLLFSLVFIFFLINFLVYLKCSLKGEGGDRGWDG